MIQYSLPTCLDFCLYFSFILPSIHPLLVIELYSSLLMSKLRTDPCTHGSYTAGQLTWLYHLSHSQQLSQIQYIPCECLCIVLLQAGVFFFQILFFITETLKRRWAFSSCLNAIWISVLSTTFESLWPMRSWLPSSLRFQEHVGV